MYLTISILYIVEAMLLKSVHPNPVLISTTYAEWTRRSMTLLNFKIMVSTIEAFLIFNTVDTSELRETAKRSQA